MSGKNSWKQGQMRNLQVWLLIAAALLPSVFFAINKLNGSQATFPLPQSIYEFAIFPSPVVFNDPSYLYEHEVVLHGLSETRMDTQQIIRRSYRLKHRYAGVTLWHFLKYSPRWSDQMIHAGLETYFCLDGQALGLVSSQDHLTSLQYSFRSFDKKDERKIEHQCGS